MSRVCVYYPADNEAGYVWESVVPEEVQVFIEQGWSRTPALIESNSFAANEPVAEPVKKKLGRPKKS